MATAGAWGMYHHVARTLDRRLAFSSWEEGRRLWDTVVGAAPGLTALCIMPDHIHLLTATDVRRRLAAALSGYTRWRNARRGGRGPLWEPAAEPSAVEGPLKIRRNIRYIHLNPCRAGLVDDPLGWPLSTHMDAVGLAVEPVRRRAPHPGRLHAYISGDPSARVDGTPLPLAVVDLPDLDAVAAAVSVSLRAPLADLHHQGSGRTLYMGAARALTSESLATIGAHVCASRTSAWRAPLPGLAELRVIECWLGDPRGAALDEASLARALGRSRYRGRHRE